MRWQAEVVQRRTADVTGIVSGDLRRKFVAYRLFVQAHCAHTNLEQCYTFINQPFHHAGMAPDAAFVVFAQVGVRIELHHTDTLAGVGIGHAHHRAIADGVFATEDKRQIALCGNFAYTFTDA